jgi:hypothetical protein
MAPEQVSCYIRNPVTGLVLCGINPPGLTNAQLSDRNALDNSQERLWDEDGTIRNKKFGTILRVRIRLSDPLNSRNQFEYSADGMLVDTATGKALTAVAPDLCRTAPDLRLNTRVFANSHQHWAFIRHSERPKFDIRLTRFTTREPG